MRKITVTLLPLILLIACTSTVPETTEEPFSRDMEFEQEVYDRLSAINPEAVPVFVAATEALDAERFEEAKAGYEQVLELAPDFPDAYRRLSYIALNDNDTKTAIAYAQAARELDDSPYNRSALAQAYIWSEDQTARREAYTLALSAFNEMPDDDSIALTFVLACATNEELEDLHRGTEALIRLAPTSPTGHYFAGLLAAEEGKWILADNELSLAMQYGLPADAIDEEIYSAIHRQAMWMRTLRTGGWVLAGWLVGLGLLFVIGVILSSATLATIKRTQPGEWGRISPTEKMIRSIYRFFIGTASAYFYASIPLLIAIVVACTVGIFYLFFILGRIPLRLAAWIGIAALYTLYAIVRSVFTRVEQRPPGKPLSREQGPRLWSLLEEIAAEVKTDPVNAIYITPLTQIGVSEHGGVGTKLTGAGERRLILGLGALPGMTMNEFKAILAHEYGHFSNRDTAGGDLALRVRATMHMMAMNLAHKGQARWSNPVWLFLNGYHRIFMRITLGASRLQEVLADRYAALAYGAHNLIEGLRHIVRQNLTFAVQANTEINLALKEQRNPANLYTLPELDDTGKKDELEQKIREEITRPTSAYDSHPSIKDRIELLEGITDQTSGSWDDQEVWSLIPDAQRLQQEMTTAVIEQARAAIMQQRR